jgi:UDP-glucose 6-dehydrogenase
MKFIPNKVSMFAGGLQTTLTSRSLPLAKVLEERGIETEVITPIAWDSLARSKLGNILSVALTYHLEKCVEAVVKFADVVIIERSSNIQAYLLAKVLKHKNVKVIFDLDDALFHLLAVSLGLKSDLAHSTWKK